MGSGLKIHEPIVSLNSYNKKNTKFPKKKEESAPADENTDPLRPQRIQRKPRAKRHPIQKPKSQRQFSEKEKAMIDQEYGSTNSKQAKKKKTQSAVAYKVYLKKDEAETQPKTAEKAPAKAKRQEDLRPTSQSRRTGASYNQTTGYSKTGNGIRKQSQYHENSNVFNQSFGCLQQDETLNGSYRDSGFEKRKQFETGHGYGKPQRNQIKYVKIEEDKTTPTTNSEDDNNKLLPGFNIRINGNEILRDTNNFQEPSPTKSPSYESPGNSDDQSIATSAIRLTNSFPKDFGWSLKTKIQEEKKREELFFNSVQLTGPKRLSFPIPSL